MVSPALEPVPLKVPPLTVTAPLIEPLLVVVPAVLGSGDGASVGEGRRIADGVGAGGACVVDDGAGIGQHVAVPDVGIGNRAGVGGDIGVLDAGIGDDAGSMRSSVIDRSASTLTVPALVRLWPAILIDPAELMLSVAPASTRMAPPDVPAEPMLPV
jgi:hypothetical protein